MKQLLKRLFCRHKWVYGYYKRHIHWHDATDIRVYRKLCIKCNKLKEREQ